jgi:hypothetical protein
MAHNLAPGRVMDSIKLVLSGLSAIVLGEFAFAWPLIGNSKATGMAAIAVMLAESIHSPRFWIVVGLSFGLFFLARRANIVLRTLFFWIPTVIILIAGIAIATMYTYLFLSFRN